MTSHATPDAEHSTTASASRAGGRKPVPVVQSRIWGPLAFAGLLIALASLYLPWVSGGGQSYSGLALPELLDLRAITPVNFLGLIGMSFFASVTLVARLGIFAILNAVTATLVLIAHVAFVWVLYGSTGTADPILAGLPAEVSVSYGPYVAVVGFVLVILGSIEAARTADYLLPDRAEARMGDRG